MRLLISLFCLPLLSFSQSNIHKETFNNLLENTKQKFKDSGYITLLKSNERVYELSQNGTDSLKINGKKKIIFILSGWCDTEGFPNLRSFDSLALAPEEYEKIFVSIGHDGYVFQNIDSLLTIRADKIFVPSNQEFGTGTWQKPTNFTSYLLSRKLNKSKDILSVMWVVLDEKGKEIYFSGQNPSFRNLLLKL
jgi:hypothetical protein